MSSKPKCENCGCDAADHGDAKGVTYCLGKESERKPGELVMWPVCHCGDLAVVESEK